MEETDRRPTGLFLLWIALMAASLAGANPSANVWNRIHLFGMKTLGAVTVTPHGAARTTTPGTGL